MAGVGLSYLRYYKIFVPLATLLVLIYVTCVRLQVHLSACTENGRPCNEMWSKKERDPEEGKDKEMMTAKVVALVQNVEYTRQCEGMEFQITRVLAAFRSCISEDGQILLKEYLSGWKEFIKFMDSLGMVFGFISQETTTKINIMNVYLAGSSGAEYHTLQSMIKHELDHGLVNFKELPRDQVPSGCRTLLRLHRALKWLEMFLYKLSISTSQDNTGKLCALAYEETLAHHHSWFVRQAAALAFLAMPPRRELLQILCVHKEEEAQFVLSTTAKSIIRVYDLTQRVYEAHGMLELP
ncbi:glycolipid transfer protein domain-containing protein 2 isoform X2 [Microcaecilia unicolor]|uniref:Ceramide-1-phosphate transfer protein n=1 Tax=Microcaecilia unicolor TaxID=1415580 RepID=A0A6P7WZV0_9AMPH|nr:glycolipid transfer protein domain-containing protein 2 isoform X2 [Microcaecilia unicolor]